MEESAILGIDPSFIMYPVRVTRGRKYATVRARVSLKLYATGKYSLTGIAGRLGIDHTAIIHYMQTRERWLA